VRTPDLARDSLFFGLDRSRSRTLLNNSFCESIQRLPTDVESNQYWQQKVDSLIRDKQKIFTMIKSAREEIRDIEIQNRELTRLAKSKDEVIIDLKMEKLNQF